MVFKSIIFLQYIAFSEPSPTGWCSAQRIKITMTAGGSHTIMWRTLVRQSPGYSENYRIMYVIARRPAADVAIRSQKIINSGRPLAAHIFAADSIIQGGMSTSSCELKVYPCIPKFTKRFGSGSSGGNVLVPARTLIRSRLKGRCRKAAPLRIPRPHRRKCVKMFRFAIGGFIE